MSKKIRQRVKGTGEEALPKKGGTKQEIFGNMRLSVVSYLRAN